MPYLIIILRSIGDDLWRHGSHSQCAKGGGGKIGLRRLKGWLLVQFHSCGPSFVAQLSDTTANSVRVAAFHSLSSRFFVKLTRIVIWWVYTSLLICSGGWYDKERGSNDRNSGWSPEAKQDARAVAEKRCSAQAVPRSPHCLPAKGHEAQEGRRYCMVYWSFPMSFIWYFISQVIWYLMGCGVSTGGAAEAGAAGDAEGAAACTERRAAREGA